MATVANVDTAVGGTALNQPTEHIAREPTEHTTYRFKRICQHYLTNNNTSSIPSVTVKASTTVNTSTAFPNGFYAVFDQGWANLPFTNPNMALNQTDIDKIVMEAAKIRVAGCGYRIVRIAASQQECGTAGATTSITNNFTQVPSVMKFEDIGHDLVESTCLNTQVSGADASAFQNILNLPGIANSVTGGVAPPIVSFPITFIQGLLPGVSFVLPLPSYGGATTTTPTAPQSYNFELLNGGGISLLSSGSHDAYHWTNENPRWFSLMTMYKDSKTTAPLNDMTLVAVPNFGLTNVVTSIMQNLATEVNHNHTHIPSMHLLRIPPLFNDAGPITLNMELWVEYSFEIDVIGGKFIQSRQVTLSEAGFPPLTVAWGQGSAVPTQLIPFPTFTRVMDTYQIGPTQIDPERKKKQHGTTPYTRQDGAKSASGFKLPPIHQMRVDND